MAQTAILLSIRPQYAEKIFEGNKTVELRRKCPKHIETGSLVIIYVSSPIKAISGAFKVEEIITKPLDELWPEVSSKASISKNEFYKYFSGLSKGVGIFFKEAQKFDEPLELKEIESSRPPQSYQYISKNKINVLIKNQNPQNYFNLLN